MNKASKPQKEPTKGKTPVAEYVLADIEARVKLGKKRYGTLLHTNNGRSALWDLYQELLDAVMYCRQEILEREGK